MPSDYPAAFDFTGDGESAQSAFTKQQDTNDLLRSHALNVVPSSPVNGEFRIDGSTPTRYVIYLRQNGADVVLIGNSGGNHVLEADLDCDDNQLLNAILENLASSPTPSAGTVGRVSFNTSTGFVELVQDSSTLVRLAYTEASASLDSVEIPLDANRCLTPSTPATEATVSEVKGFLFDADGEEAALTAWVPAGWDGASDLLLRLTWALNAAETASDTIDTDMDWIAATPGADGLGKTETAATTASTSIGASTTAGDVIQQDLTINYDDVDNPVAAGDLMRFTVRASNVGTAGKVGARVLVDARLVFYCRNFDR